MASVDALVAAFFKGLGEDGLDEDVRAYVSATVSEVDEDSDPADIAEMFAGFSPAFSELGAECQMSEVLLLLTAAREATTKGGPPEDHGERVAYGALSGSDASSGGDVASQEAEEAERQRLQQEEKEAKVDTLLGLCPPAASRAYIAHVLRDSFQGDIELAAQWVLEHDVLAKGEEWQAAEKAAAARREKEQREHAKEKKRLAERYQFQRVSANASGKQAPVRMWEPSEPQEAKKAQVRYNNNEIVSRKGEKYVTQSLKEDWNGGSTGKVYTKGKRGKGYV
eukprot:jgi/Tetstr1/432701/TSEL_022068.t1